MMLGRGRARHGGGCGGAGAGGGGGGGGGARAVAGLRGECKLSDCAGILTTIYITF